MANFGKGGEGPGVPESRGSAATAAESDVADPAEEGVRSLPGVVNDLPEVAPHEWIYLMG